MTAVAQTAQPAFRSLLGRWPRAVELACRAGYVARGFVYISIGSIGLLAALRLAPRARGVMASLDAFSSWPLGFVLLWLAGLGLYAFAVWRALQALFDADHQGDGPAALASRCGQAISGVTYGLLGVSVFGLVDTLTDLRRADDDEQTRQAVSQLLAMPGGEWLVTLAGLFVLACAVGNLVQAAFRDFCRHLDCERAVAGHAAFLGRMGYFARGLVFAVAGTSLVAAGLHARSNEVKGTGAALDWLAVLPMGRAWLAFVALGLIAFGLYALVEARFRLIFIATPAAAPSVSDS